MSRKLLLALVLASGVLTNTAAATAATVETSPQPDGSVITTTFESWTLSPGEAGYSPPPEGADLRKSGRHSCYKARVYQKSESLGVFQWGITLVKSWCGYPSGRIFRQERNVYTSTGTNWKRISRVSRTKMSSRRKGKTYARAHFQLKYPHFEQNKRPEVGIRFNSSGHSRSWRT